VLRTSTSDGDQGSKIQVVDYAKDEVEVVNYEDEFDRKAVVKRRLEDAQLNQQPTKRADMVWRNLAKSYGAIAKGETDSRLCDFETAMRRQEILEKMWRERFLNVEELPE
jgi:hypothetical protein